MAKFLNIKIIRILFGILFFMALIMGGIHFRGELEKFHELSLHRRILFVPLFASQIAIWWSLSYSWKTSLRLMGKHHIRTGDAFVHVTLCNAAKYIPGSLWGYLARHHLLVADGVSHLNGISVMSWDALGSLLSGIFVGSLLCITVIVQMGAHLWLICAILVLLSIAIAVPRVLLLMPTSWRRVLRIDALDVTDSGMRFLYVNLAYSFTWLIVGASYCTVSAMILPEFPTLQDAFIVAGSCCLGIVAGFLAFFAPGGIGVREALSSSVMATVVPLEHAFAIAICFRIWTTFTDIFGGVLGLLWHRSIQPRIK